MISKRLVTETWSNALSVNLSWMPIDDARPGVAGVCGSKLSDFVAVQPAVPQVTLFGSGSKQ